MTPRGVNTQITDAVTQTNVKTVAEAQAEAIGLSVQVLAHSVGLSMETASQVQAGMQQINNMSTGAIVAAINAAKGPLPKSGTQLNMSTAPPTPPPVPPIPPPVMSSTAQTPASRDQ